jgi:large subunit ribosomal protein L15
VVNLNDLERLTSDKVDLDSLKAVGLIRSNSTNVKLLGSGEVNKSYVVSVNQISKSAKEKIIAAGGSVSE